MIWDGSLPQGGQALHGRYSFEVESRHADGTVVDTQPAEIYTRVSEVQSTPQGLQVLTANGDRVAASSVSGLRDPG
jgi:flagellar basal-body rod modification protein FlgD